MGGEMTLLSAPQDLFRRHREGATGQWRLGSDPQRNIFLDQGRIVFATSTHPLDRLTHLLVEKGRLTQDQMDYAMTNLQPGMSVGKNLIQLGFITQRDLLDMAKLQVERVVWGAIGTLDGNPEFIAKELDKSVVRLNLDTASLLLGGLLNLKDRERLLELLGPLTQVMVLDQVRLSGLTLPPDLARVPGLMNGRRTLLELSRDAVAEPMRLGAFVLFLLEMGWGHLQDQPEPTTEDLLNLPLNPPLNEGDIQSMSLEDEEPEHHFIVPPIISLSEIPEPSPVDLPPAPLFESIQAASTTTHNLEHLANSLDRMEDLFTPENPFQEPKPDPENQDEPALAWPSDPEIPKLKEPYQIESGRAKLPSPRMNLPFPAESLEPDASTNFGEGTPEEPKSHPRWGLMGMLVLLLGLGAGAGYWWTQRKPAAPAAPAYLVVPSVNATGGTGPNPVSTPSGSQVVAKEPVPPKATAPKAEPPAPTKPPPLAPTPAPVADSNQGELAKAYAQGQAKRAGLPKNSWAIRLEIACQVETVHHAAKVLDAAGQAYFVIPIKMKNDKTCTQIFQGPFSTRDAAEAHTKQLPALFRDGGNKPRPYLVSEIPDKQ